MSDTTTSTASEFSFLDMSDEDLSKYSPDNLPPGTGETQPATEDESDDTAESVEELSTETADNASAEDAGAGGSADTADTADSPKEPEAPKATAPVAAANPHADAAVPPKEGEKAAPAKGAEAEKAEKPAEPAAAAVNYEAEYKRLIGTPIKANGKDITITSVEDAISLMQMGANYNKKMAGLKPNLTLLKMLENNGLLSEEKLSFLIDLSKKDAGAISKLVKDAGIDPMDLDVDKAGAYKPGSHKVDDREVELDAVLDEIQASPSYARTIQIVGKDWDATSKQAIADEPQLLKVINSHVERGVYDLISQEVERERMLGRLKGLSDFAAYRHIGDAMNARGGFDHLGRQGQPNQPAPAVVAPKSEKAAVSQAKLNEKRRAAGASKPAAPTPTTPAAGFNPLALSDEEFAKLAKPRYA